ncbi:MAG: LysR family transcriptional regulator [Spirochaetales bacterium]|nr:LysR family transcriptional regulator [Spirochaetales bacterium]
MLDITFEQIRAFLAVAKYGNFSIAAEKIFRTQAALSIQVARLEQTLHTRLFDRTTKKVNLTDTGNVLFHYLKQIEHLLIQADAELRDLQQVIKGRLVLSTSDTTACYRLPGILQKYNRQYPGVDIIIQNATSPRTMELVMDNAIDLGIISLVNVPPDLKSIPLFPRYDVVICYPEHPLYGRKEILLKDLETYNCILLDHQCATRQLLDQYCFHSRVTLKIIMELSSVEVIKRFVMINSGISIIPAIAVKEEVAGKKLAVIKIRDYQEQKPVQMGVVYKRNRYLSAAVKSFIDTLKKEFLINQEY